MRLGAYPCVLSPGSRAFHAYGQSEISERHRHRYEFNREYEETLVAHGLRIVGVSPDNNFVEVVEVEDHPWFVGCQFHPEFKSKPLSSHPLFKAFVEASYANRKERRASLDESLQSELVTAKHRLHAAGEASAFSRPNPVGAEQ
jgi:CTP synthase